MENKLKETETPEVEEKEGAAKKVSAKLGEFVKLSQEKVDDYLRFFIFLVGIGLLYVWNAHLADKQVIKESKLKKEIRELRLHYVAVETEISKMKKPSNVAKQVADRKLELPRTAPYQIVKLKNSEK